MNETVNALLAKAKAGDREAQYRLALCYKNRDGVDANIQEERHWFVLAGDNGIPDAYFQLGDSLYQLGIHPDCREAYEKYGKLTGYKGYYKIADKYYADKSYRMVIFALEAALKLVKPSAKRLRMLGEAYCYEYADDTEGLKYMAMAAEKGDIPAMLYLGKTYRLLTEQGVRRDVEKSNYYYNMAAETGDTQACREYWYYAGVSEAEKHYHLGVGEEARYGGDNSSTGLAHLQKALEHYRKAAESGFGDAMFALGRLHETNEKAHLSLPLAVSYYAKATSLGQKAAAECLCALVGSKGSLPAQKVADALVAGKAAGNQDADGLLASLYVKEGKLKGQALALAVAACLAHEKDGDPMRKLRLAELYEKGGGGVKKDKAKAAALYREAFEGGIAEAEKKAKKLSKYCL